MGLDNGIFLSRVKNNVRDMIPARWIEVYGGGEYAREVIEPIYMRKWWGVRDDIVNYLNEAYNSNEEKYEWDLSVNDIREIRDIFYYWLDEDVWENDGGSTIWAWEDNIPEQLGLKIAACNKLIRLMEDYPDGFIVTFYDSY